MEKYGIYDLVLGNSLIYKFTPSPKPSKTPLNELLCSFVAAQIPPAVDRIGKCFPVEEVSKP